MEYVYIIRKLSRAGCWPYAGPACESAAVPMGFTYFDEGDAQTDASLLKACNPVGFEVVKMRCLFFEKRMEEVE